jgi:Ca2+:H+ antiporter
MTESSDEPPIDRIGIWDRVKIYASNLNFPGTSGRGGHDRDSSILPVTNPSSTAKATSHRDHHDGHPSTTDAQLQPPEQESSKIQDSHDFKTRSASRSIPVDTQGGEKDPAVKSKAPVSRRFWTTLKLVIMSSWINWLLLFVPVGIALGAMHRSLGDKSPVSPTVIFALNAIAIIPLAWMLGYATECVAANMGDTIGALLNVTFGNAVELIILYVSTPFRCHM